MKVFVTGGTGFVGAEIIDRLVDAGYGVRALVRPGSARGSSHFPGEVERVSGDILDADLEKRLAGVDAVIHLVGIIRAFPARGVTFERLHTQATQNVIRAMPAAGVSRLIHMSALGAGPDATTGYFRTKWEAESAVRASGLDWTVMKPSVIFGPGDEFVNMLAGQVRLSPLIPVMGDGNYRLQPVSVRDVATGFVSALVKDESVGKIYEVGGPAELSYNELLDAIAQALGKARAIKVHIPLGLIKPVIRLLEGFSFFPVTQDQLAMLLMNNVCDPGPYFEAFDIKPVSFHESIKEYI